MFKKIMLVLSVLALPALAGCATTPTVYSNSNSTQDFSSYKTFSWAKNPPAVISGDYAVTPMSEDRMTNSIKEAFIAKGYVFTEDEASADFSVFEDEASADFSVFYTVGASDKLTIKNYPAVYYNNYDNWGWGYNYYAGNRYGSMSNRYDPFLRSSFYGGGSSYRPARTETRTSIEGSISIDVFDVKSKRPVWHGSASKKLQKNEMAPSPKNEIGVGELLIADFPIK